MIADFCRTQTPALWLPPNPAIRELRSLMRHLDDVKTMRQQQRNRLKSGATSSLTRRSLRKLIRFFDAEIKVLEKQIQEHIKQHPELKTLCDLLITIPGVAHLTACKLISEIQDIELFDQPKQLAAYASIPVSTNLVRRSEENLACPKKATNNCVLLFSRPRLLLCDTIQLFKRLLNVISHAVIAKCLLLELLCANSFTSSGVFGNTASPLFLFIRQKDRF